MIDSQVKKQIWISREDAKFIIDKLDYFLHKQDDEDHGVPECEKIISFLEMQMKYRNRRFNLRDKDDYSVSEMTFRGNTYLCHLKEEDN